MQQGQLELLSYPGKEDLCRDLAARSVMHSQAAGHHTNVALFKQAGGQAWLHLRVCAPSPVPDSSSSSGPAGNEGEGGGLHGCRVLAGELQPLQLLHAAHQHRERQLA